MTTKFNVSLVQFQAKLLDTKTNGQRMVQFAKDEAERGAKLIVFPELSNTGYIDCPEPGDVFETNMSFKNYANALYHACASKDDWLVEAFLEIALKYDAFIIAGLAMKAEGLAGVMDNSSVLIGPHGVIGQYNKMHRWHNEKLYFRAGEKIDTFEMDETTLGMQICYDIRFPELTRILSLKGAKIITNIWAAYERLDEKNINYQQFIHRLYARAIENGVFMLSCNRSGDQGAHRYLGRSCIIAPNGRIVAQSESDKEECIRGIVDLDEINQYRSEFGIYTDYNPTLYQKYFSALIK